MTPPQPAVDCHCHIGENLLWHSIQRCLYWTDIPRGKKFRYFPVTDRSEPCYDDDPVGGFTLQADDEVRLFMV